MKTDKYLLVAGTYTDGAGKGLYSYSFDPTGNKFELLAYLGVANPSYISLCKDRKCLYTVTENPQNPSYANVFLIDRQTGALQRKSRRETKGAGPCYIAADPESRFVATANYADGSISVFPLVEQGDMRSLSQVIPFSGHGKDSRRQESPHIHCLGFSPDRRYLFASDLGTDRIYRLDIERGDQKMFLKESTLIPFPVEPGSGPRHFRFSPDGRSFYLINELSGTVMVFEYESGNLTHRQTLPVRGGRGGDGGDIVLTPDGKYLYASMREGNDGIGVFSVDRSSGLLTKAGYVRTAKHPRNLSVSPDGRFLLCAAMKDHVIEAYTIDRKTGKPEVTGARISLDSPACTVFVK